MRASLNFVERLADERNDVVRVRVDLYGSLALTGVGHGTDRAVLAGLSGEQPALTDAEKMTAAVKRVDEEQCLLLAGERSIHFSRESDLLFHRNQMYPDSAEATHPNGMRFSAFSASGDVLSQQTYYSIGGGFIVTAEDFAAANASSPTSREMPYPFRSAKELLSLATEHRRTIAELMFANEVTLTKVPEIVHPPNTEGRNAEEVVRNGTLALWSAMRKCAERGMETDGVLPGGLNVRRRATRLSERLREKGSRDPLAPLDWVTVYAMAVNEENAAGGRVVTAPTNGAAGVIPAVGLYYSNFIEGANDDGLMRYMLTAAAIGILYKENASISGAEVGCQGEVGVACSMAAGGLVAALGGSNAQVEHAAEIAMEHNLGMTCDPIGGLVQIPCIERNAMGAVKAVNASRMAMNELDEHKVSLDQVIQTMYQTGLDMQSRYKETSLAGLALNIIEC
jgi:L-serine dehydratase